MLPTRSGAQRKMDAICYFFRTVETAVFILFSYYRHFDPSRMIRDRGIGTSIRLIMVT
jgi:hypothetical protein